MSAPLWTLAARKRLAPKAVRVYAIDRLIASRTDSARRGLLGVICGRAGSFPEWEDALQKLVRDPGQRERAFEALRHLANVETSTGRLHAIALLRVLKWPLAKDVLRPMLRDPEIEVSVAAATALCAVEDTGSAPLICDWATDNAMTYQQQVRGRLHSCADWLIARVAEGAVSPAAVVAAFEHVPNRSFYSLKLLLAVLQAHRSQPEVDFVADAFLDALATTAPPHRTGLSSLHVKDLRSLGLPTAEACLARLIDAYCERWGAEGWLTAIDEPLELLHQRDPARATAVVWRSFNNLGAKPLERCHAAHWLVAHGNHAPLQFLVEYVQEALAQLSAIGTQSDTTASSGTANQVGSLKRDLEEAMRPLSKFRDSAASTLLACAVVTLPPSSNWSEIAALRGHAIGLLVGCRNLSQIDDPTLELLAKQSDEHWTSQRGGPYIEYVPGVGDVGRTEPIWFETTTASRDNVRRFADGEIRRRRGAEGSLE
jgi:hypothetical protein